MKAFDLSSLRFTVRTPDSESYLPIEETGLITECRAEAGDGTPGNPFRLEMTVTNPGPETRLGVIRIETAADADDPAFFLPGYFYGHNTGELPDSGRKPFPRIRKGKTGKPFSDFFMTRSDRLALPVALMTDGSRVRGISAPAWYARKDGKTVPAVPGDDPKSFFRFAGFTFRTGGKTGTDDAVAVGYTLGYENAPWLFIQTATVRDRAPLTDLNCLPLSSGSSVSCTLRVYDFAITERTEILSVFEEVYSRVHESPRVIPGMSFRKAAAAVAGAVDTEAWLENEDLYAGFVYDRPGGNTENKLGSLSWTNGLTVAVPQLIAGLRLEDPGMTEHALRCIRTITENCMNPASGLPYDAVTDGQWSIRGWWYDGMHMPGHSGYLAGQAVWYVLKAFLAEKELAGRKHPEWLAFAEKVQERLDREISGDGEYPFVFSEQTGTGLEYDSLGSCWCLASGLLLSRITGKQDCLPVFRKCEQHYYDRFVRRLECFGGPLDTDKATDNEGILAYIRCARLMHELTGEEVYLKHLRDAIGYECSFRLGYNTPVQVPPLSTVGWSSSGGSITSVANPHIHPMSSTVADEMLYCAEKTGDPYIRSRLQDTLGWGLQTFNTEDGEYGYGKTGWMSERFCFCEGLVTEKYPDGSPASTWFALMPWAACSVTEGFLGDCWHLQETGLTEGTSPASLTES